MASRRIPPPPAVAWRGARTACDGDGGCGGRADAGRALREVGPEAAQARSDRDERTPRNGPRGRAPSARPIRRRLKRGANAPSGRPGAARGGVSGAASGRRGRPVAGGAGRATRRAVPCERARHRRRPVPKCGEKSEAEPGGGWDREREEARAACTPPRRRAPRDRRVRASPSAPAFRNAAPWEPGARDRRRPRRVAGIGDAPGIPGRRQAAAGGEEATDREGHFPRARAESSSEPRLPKPEERALSRFARSAACASRSSAAAAS